MSSHAGGRGGCSGEGQARAAVAVDVIGAGGPVRSPPRAAMQQAGVPVSASAVQGSGFRARPRPAQPRTHVLGQLPYACLSEAGIRRALEATEGGAATGRTVCNLGGPASAHNDCVLVVHAAGRAGAASVGSTHLGPCPAPGSSRGLAPAHSSSAPSLNCSHLGFQALGADEELSRLEDPTTVPPVVGWRSQHNGKGCCTKGRLSWRRSRRRMMYCAPVPIPRFPGTITALGRSLSSIPHSPTTGKPCVRCWLPPKQGSAACCRWVLANV